MDIFYVKNWLGMTWFSIRYLWCKLIHRNFLKSEDGSDILYYCYTCKMVYWRTK